MRPPSCLPGLLPAVLPASALASAFSTRPNAGQMETPVLCSLWLLVPLRAEARRPSKVLRPHRSSPHPPSRPTLPPLSCSPLLASGFPASASGPVCPVRPPGDLALTCSPSLLPVWTQMPSSHMHPCIPFLVAFLFSRWPLTPSNYIFLIYWVSCLFPQLEYKLHQGRDFCLFFKKLFY